jgi:hypothetical protein
MREPEGAEKAGSLTFSAESTKQTLVPVFASWIKQLKWVIQHKWEDYHEWQKAKQDSSNIHK